MSAELKHQLLVSLYETHARELAECLRDALAGVHDVARCNRILILREKFSAKG
jgi:hypothetical protein